jgi:hypothetical protein
MVMLIEWPNILNYCYKYLQQMKTYREKDRQIFSYVLFN